MTWHPVTPADRLPPGAMVDVKAGKGWAIVVNAGGDIRAWDDRCPHSGYPLSEGAFHAGEVVCFYHGYCFDARTGVCADPNPAARLTPLPLKVEEGMIWVGDDTTG